MAEMFGSKIASYVDDLSNEYKKSVEALGINADVLLKSAHELTSQLRKDRVLLEKALSENGEHPTP